MTSKLDTSPGPSERARVRRFAFTFVLTMVAFGLVLAASLIWGDLDGDSPWRLAWAVAPAVPIAVTAGVLIRYVASSDEFEILQLCKSLAVGFVAAMMASIVAGLLGAAGLELPGLGFIIYGVGMFTWLVASIVLRIR
jgi:hypothetical protein